jgi:hypothetical protein
MQRITLMTGTISAIFFTTLFFIEATAGLGGF